MIGVSVSVTISTKSHYPPIFSSLDFSSVSAWVNENYSRCSCQLPFCSHVIKCPLRSTQSLQKERQTADLNDLQPPIINLLLSSLCLFHCTNINSGSVHFSIFFFFSSFFLRRASEIQNRWQHIECQYVWCSLDKATNSQQTSCKYFFFLTASCLMKMKCHTAKSPVEQISWLLRLTFTRLLLIWLGFCSSKFKVGVRPWHYQLWWDETVKALIVCPQQHVEVCTASPWISEQPQLRAGVPHCCQHLLKSGCPVVSKQPVLTFSEEAGWLVAKEAIRTCMCALQDNLDLTFQVHQTLIAQCYEWFMQPKDFKHTEAKSVKKLEEEYLLNVWCRQELLTSHLAIVTFYSFSYRKKKKERWVYVLPAVLMCHSVSLLHWYSDGSVFLSSTAISAGERIFTACHIQFQSDDVAFVETLLNESQYIHNS